MCGIVAFYIFASGQAKFKALIYVTSLLYLALLLEEKLFGETATAMLQAFFSHTWVSLHSAVCHTY